MNTSLSTLMASVINFSLSTKNNWPVIDLITEQVQLKTYRISKKSETNLVSVDSWLNLICARARSLIELLRIGAELHLSKTLFLANFRDLSTEISEPRPPTLITYRVRMTDEYLKKPCPLISDSLFAFLICTLEYFLIVSICRLWFECLFTIIEVLFLGVQN